MDIQAISIALGLAVGIIMSLTGAGGTVLSVPLLVFALHLPINKAAPIGLLAAMLAASVGASMGLRAGIVRYKAAGLMVAFGLACAPAGLWLAQRLPNGVLTMVFSLVLGLIAVNMLRHSANVPADVDGDKGRATRVCKIDPLDGKFLWTAPCARSLMFSGALAGFLSGLLGVGGGFIFIPALRAVSDLDIKSIVATSLATTALVTFGSVLLAISKGIVDWHIAMPFAAGAVLGMLAGSLVAHRIAPAHTHRVFAVLALIVAGGLLFKLAS
jgi:hypothetical protein